MIHSFFFRFGFYLLFLLDIKILIMTVLKVVKSEGINEQGQATSNEFKGNNIE